MPTPRFGSGHRDWNCSKMPTRVAVAPAAFSRARSVRSARRARSFGRLRSKSARLSRLPTSTNDRVEIVGLVVEERDGAVGVDAVDAQASSRPADRTAAHTRSQQRRAHPSHGPTRPALRTIASSRRECSSSRAARTSLAASKRLSSSCLASQVRPRRCLRRCRPIRWPAPICARSSSRCSLLRLLVELAFAAQEVTQRGIEFADFGCDLGEPVGGGESDYGRVGEVAVRAAAAVAGLPVAGDAGPVAVEVRRRFDAQVIGAAACDALADPPAERGLLVQQLPGDVSAGRRARRRGGGARRLRTGRGRAGGWGRWRGRAAAGARSSTSRTRAME